MPGVKPETQQTYQQIMDRYVFSRFQGVASGAPDSTLTHATIEGPSLSNGMREIDKIASAARKRGGDGHDLAGALATAKGSLMNAVSAQEPVTAKRLAAADEMWSHYAELRSAGTRARGQMAGQFTPSQLGEGAYSADKSAFKRSTSEGTTRYGDFARAGADVGIEPPTRPPLMTKLEGAGIAGAAAALHPGTIGMFPAAWAYASSPGQATMKAYLQALGPPIHAAAPMVGRAMAVSPTAMAPTADAVRQALGDAVRRALGQRQQQ